MFQLDVCFLKQVAEVLFLLTMSQMEPINIIPRDTWISRMKIMEDGNTEYTLHLLKIVLQDIHIELNVM